VTFERSPEGIANRHLFLDVDLVAYHESTSEHSLDKYFWNGIFAKHAPNRRIAYLAKGSKEEVIQTYRAYLYAQDGRSIFLLDRDLDGVVGSQLRDRCVVYTYGYSYENDICQVETVSRAIRVYYHESGMRSKVEAYFGRLLARDAAYLVRMSLADRAARRYGMAGISRANYMKFFENTNYGAEPMLSRKVLRKFLMEARKGRAGRRLRAKRVDRNWRRRIVGHFLFEYFFAAMQTY
jgi:hypothetical protein